MSGFLNTLIAGAAPGMVDRAMAGIGQAAALAAESVRLQAAMLAELRRIAEQNERIIECLTRPSPMPPIPQSPLVQKTRPQDWPPLSPQA